MSKSKEEIERRLVFQQRIESLVQDDDNDRSILLEKIGIASPTFSRVVNYGIIPKTKILLRIADYFEASIDYLLGRLETNHFENSIEHDNFYSRLDKLRIENGFKNYSELANETYLPRQYFNDWIKKNYYPTINILEDLADFFKVSIDYLLGRTDDR